MNFKPVMEKGMLLEGYRKILHDIYSSKSYYKRVLSFLKRCNLPNTFNRKLTFNSILALLKSVVYLGFIKGPRRYYWLLVLWSLLNKPKALPLAVTYSIYGYHFRKVFDVNT
jgi:hypothetical protein